jgi:hypothetical protein
MLWKLEVLGIHSVLLSLVGYTSLWILISITDVGEGENRASGVKELVI